MHSTLTGFSTYESFDEKARKFKKKLAKNDKFKA